MNRTPSALRRKPLNRQRPRHLAGDSHKCPPVSADIPSGSATRSPSGIASVSRSLGLPHPHSGDPTRSVAGSAPRARAYRGPRRVCRSRSHRRFSVWPHIHVRGYICGDTHRILHLDTPGDPRRNPRGGFYGRFYGQVYGKPCGWFRTGSGGRTCSCLCGKPRSWFRETFR